MLRLASLFFASSFCFPGQVLAQSLPIVPDAAECVVEPRPIDFFEPLVAELFSATPVASPVPTRLAEDAGEPADAATVAEVIAVTRQMIACSNAGEFSRMVALFTDEAARDAVLVGWGDGVRAVRKAAVAQGRAPFTEQEFLAHLTTRDPPQPGEFPTSLVAIRDVQEFPDGRVTATLIRTLADGSEAETRAVFRKEEGQLRLDGETVVTIQGTPVP